MANYQEARVKLTNAHINKLKSSGKNNAGTTLRTTEKNILVDELPQIIFSNNNNSNNRTRMSLLTICYLISNLVNLSWLK